MTGSWLDEPLMALDTETTGVDPQTARILSITFGHSDRHRRWRPRTGYLVPDGFEIPEASTKVHGLTADRLAELCLDTDRREWIEEAHLVLASCAESGRPIVGHNLRYDLGVLRSEFDREGLGPVPSGLIVLDTLVLFRRLDWRTGCRTLSKLAERHGIVFPAHGAEADALASLRLLHIIANENELLPHVPPRVLHDMQVGWYADQQSQAEAKAIGNGTPHAPAPGWPLPA